MFGGLKKGILTGDNKSEKKSSTTKTVAAKKQPVTTKTSGEKISKLKTWVKKAVNCCIE
jgi:hypothetical protein